MIKKIIIVILISVLSLLITPNIHASNYGYDYYQNVMNAPHAYTENGNIHNTDFIKLSDVKYFNEKIYILDEVNGLFIYSKEGVLLKHIRSYMESKEPEVYFSELCEDIDITYAFFDSIDFVKQNIGLKTSSDASVVWTSSNEEFITSSGVVTRPSIGSADETVTLMATISYLDFHKVLTFELTVLALTNGESDEKGDLTYIESTIKPYAESTFFEPNSIDITDEYIYVADTGNQRIVILSEYDEHGQKVDDIRFVKNIVVSNDIIGLEDIAFRPQKIAVDHAGRIYVVARDVYEGIMEFDFDGNFKKFFGTNEININLWDYFWRSLLSDSAVVSLYLPVVFTNLVIDNEGFVYTTTESADSKPVQKFNYKGEDVLVQNGVVPVIGDITEQDNSIFRAIDINEYGIYIVLDTNKKRIFAYNDTGELLYVIGNEGTGNNELSLPVAISFFEENILVADANLGTVFIYEATKYGRAINNATRCYYQGNLEESMEYWEEVLHLNTNNDLSYVGIGKVYFMQEKYEEAVRYFQLGHSKAYYSKAFEKYRNDWLRENFTTIFIILIIGGIAIFGYSKYKKWRKT